MGAPNTLVRSGADVVNANTGEVIPEFSMVQYIGELAKPATLDLQRSLAAAYDAACRQLLGPNDVQKDGAREFKKKSAWKKLARYFTVSTRVMKVEKEFFGEDFLATVTVRASAPWGQSAEAVGACGTDEESGNRKITIADAIATGETRASNRAISNLIAMGEVTAEEVSRGTRRAAPPPVRDPLAAPAAAPAPRAASATPAGKRDEDKLMPFGEDKGKSLGECETPSLVKTLRWCNNTDAAKFDSLITAISNVLAAREPANSTGIDEEFPSALREEESDDLPF